MSRRFDHIADVEAFVMVAEKGSMTSAAIALGRTASVLSRAVTRLETHLGVQLLRRTTRRLSLTEQGRLYLEQARAAFTLFEDVERNIQGVTDTLSGNIRVSVPTTYGHFRLPEILQRFYERYPNVRIDLSIANRNVDLVGEGFDFAIRLGQIPDSGLVARKLEDAPLCLIAAPGYLQRAGTPQCLADLEHHSCLHFVMPSTGRISPWLFRENDEDIEILPKGNIHIHDDVLGLVSLARSGIGICQTYDFIARDLIQHGSVVEIMAHTRGRSKYFSLIYPPHRRLSNASRALIDFIIQHQKIASPSADKLLTAL